MLARKQRSEWNSDKKIKATSFDDMWEDHQPAPKEMHLRKSEPAHSVKRGWAKVGLEVSIKSMFGTLVAQWCECPPDSLRSIPISEPLIIFIKIFLMLIYPLIKMH